MTTPFIIDRFGGLNVADDPTDVGAEGATDLLNVDLFPSGRLRCRCGYSLIKSIGAVTTAGGLAAFEKSDGTSQVVVAYDLNGTKKLDAYASTGGAAVSTATPTAIAMSTVRWGDPTSEYLYIANGADTIWRWTGAAFSKPAGMPTATYLTVAPASNRLVTANLSGLPSRVLFSDAGAPETFTYDTVPNPDTGSYVDLTPGDGSVITGLAAFSGQVYAFKKARFFVFTTESTSATGKPIFNYRPVDGYGALVPPVAGDEGVFFFDGQSIWLTTGDVPTRISRPIEPILRGTGGSISVPALSQTLLASVRMFYSLGRLFVRIPGATGSFTTTLIYDPKLGAWTSYFTESPVEWVATVKPASTEQKFTYFFGGLLGDVNKFDPALTVDASSVVSIPWRWTSGATDMGEPARVKVTLESRIWGVGSAALAVGVDGGAIDAGSQLTLGVNPAVADAWQLLDREGTLWRTDVENIGYGGVDRIIHYIAHVKPIGVQ